MDAIYFLGMDWGRWTAAFLPAAAPMENWTMTQLPHQASEHMDVFVSPSLDCRVMPIGIVPTERKRHSR